MGKIDIQFETVMYLSKQLSLMAAEIKSDTVGKLLEHLCSEKAIWKGEAADAITQKEVRLNEEISAEATCLQDLAKKLENKAKEMYCAESINRTLAQTRIYL